MAVDSVSLVVMYPRKELGPESDDETMIQLGLAPSAVVVVRVAKVRASPVTRQLKYNIFLLFFPLDSFY